MSGGELAHTQKRIASFWPKDQKAIAAALEEARPGIAATELPPEFADVFERANRCLAQASDEDRDEMVNLMEDICDALAEDRRADADKACAALDDILFYLE